MVFYPLLLIVLFISRPAVGVFANQLRLRIAFIPLIFRVTHSLPILINPQCIVHHLAGPLLLRRGPDLDLHHPHPHPLVTLFLAIE